MPTWRLGMRTMSWGGTGRRRRRGAGRGTGVTSSGRDYAAGQGGGRDAVAGSGTAARSFTLYIYNNHFQQ